MSISELYRAVSSIGTVAPASSRDARPVGKAADPGPSEFQEVLRRQQLNFSQHAETRIKSREIHWDAGIERRVSEGLDTVEQKGSREALILIDNLALIANVKSRTIITAMDKTQLKERVFTNIDSAVIV